MGFKSKKELGGKVDVNINTLGRIQGKETMTNRQIREREFLSLLRKLKPLVAESINTAAKIMKNEEANDANKLKAAVILLDNYKAMVGQVYDVDHDEDENEPPQAAAPVKFSLHVLEKPADKE